MSSTWHEPVYHAAHACQAASLSLTATRLRGLKWACQVESQKNAGVLALVERDQHELWPLSRSACVLLLCVLKGGRLIAAATGPYGKDDPHPHVSKRSDRDGMALALGPLALVIFLGPGFLVGTLPSELVQGIAPGLDAAQPTMRFLVRPALEEDWRGASQSLQAASTLIAAAVIAYFGQQSRSKTRSSSWQSLEEFAIGVHQKKARNLLVVASNLLEQRFQLVEQGQHQPRFGARRNLIGLQARPLEVHRHPLGRQLRSWIPGLFEYSCQVLCRSGASRLQGGIGAQEFQRRGLVQLAEQVQNNGVVGFEAGRELVDQASLHLDQRILVAGQGFDLLNLLTVGIEPTQILEVGTPGFGQQIGVNAIGLRSRGGSSLLNGTRIDRVDGPSLFQQMSDQESMRRFHDAGDLLPASRTSQPFQVRIQLAQSFGTMSNADRAEALPVFIDARSIMVIICPINATKSHRVAPSFGFTWLLNGRVLILWRSKRDSLMTSWVQEPG